MKKEVSNISSPAVKYFIYAFLLLFLMAQAGFWHIAPQTETSCKKEQKTTQKDAKTEKPEPSVTLETANFDAISHSFSADWFFNFAVLFAIHLPLYEYKIHTPIIAVFLLSFFQNTFCHHIAINAP